MAEVETEIPVGRIAGVYGIKGWVRIVSYTAPPEVILDYRPWRVRRGEVQRVLTVAEGRAHGKRLVARIEGIEDRDAATALAGAVISVHAGQLEPLNEGEYYWAQLIGLRVTDRRGRELGVVDHLIETGANDVLVIRGEREILIPYLPGEVIESIDLDNGVMRVDWQL